MSTKRVLVTGAAGMLGHALSASCPDGVAMVGVDVAEMDVTDADAVSACVAMAAPDAVINGAAYTNVDGCEEHEADALAVNGHGAGHVAAACAALGIPVLHVSTDYVFDGRMAAPGAYAEDHPTGPLSAYGRTKLAGEQAVAAATECHWIVRTQWLYGNHGGNFVETMLRLAGQRDRLAVVDDQVGSPTSTLDLARCLWAFLERRPAYGTYHCRNAGNCSWFDFAVEIFRQAELDVIVDRTDSETFRRPAPRPARSVLSLQRLEAELGWTMPAWEDALKRYLAARPSGDALAGEAAETPT